MAHSSFHKFIFGFCTSLLIITTLSHGEIGLPSEEHVSLFIFGDSIFDAGNNNYINTSLRANFRPYGESFFKHPTGRFSDGRLISDFIAEYANLPFIPPYLQPGNHQFTYGANFASAGAGALVETSQGLVIDLHSQLSYFERVRESLTKNLGEEEANTLISRAVYLFSVGGNDYSYIFGTNSSILRTQSHREFVGTVLGNITAAINEIYKKGGRNFGFLSLDPLGCLPFARVVEQEQNGRGCFKEISPYVKLHNKALPKLLQKLETKLKGFRYSLSDYNEFLRERINHPSKYGFEEGKAACCGSGAYRGIFSCGGQRGIREYKLCPNASEYVFFDSAHPTERVNEQFARLFWSGTPISTSPYNLKALFE
ncbi:PREDICTED: GDSL esterase/lipase 5-like isoform X1 [Fragaria vesca subsp. vesca]|uniref:GDSL esterase/lipase 5-like isoform X1 n=1 Tax=Fragaria vesca subsp. vesca TaxID=101020 RepID=UPI0002C31CFB|nr:PREDICTED: GDSL esterase/lipase 5-like isoform X1 [Fragaria vesca subsp. vesca]